MRGLSLGLVNFSGGVFSKLFPGQLFFGKTAPVREEATLEFLSPLLTPNNELSDKERVSGTYLSPHN